MDPDWYVAEWTTNTTDAQGRPWEVTYHLVYDATEIARYCSARPLYRVVWCPNVSAWPAWDGAPEPEEDPDVESIRQDLESDYSLDGEMLGTDRIAACPHYHYGATDPDDTDDNDPVGSPGLRRVCADVQGNWPTFNAPAPRWP